MGLSVLGSIAAQMMTAKMAVSIVLGIIYDALYMSEYNHTFIPSGAYSPQRITPDKKLLANLTTHTATAPVQYPKSRFLPHSLAKRHALPDTENAIT
jgi:hypothetical protein